MSDHVAQRIFEDYVAEAIDSLPPHIRGALHNVAFVVETTVRPAKAREIGITVHDELLGLYEGIPKIEREGRLDMAPDKITIFQEPIEQMARGNAARLRRIVYDTVLHEVGHHLGLDDEALHEIEKRRWRAARRARQ